MIGQAPRKVLKAQDQGKDKAKAGHLVKEAEARQAGKRVSAELNMPCTQLKRILKDRIKTHKEAPLIT